MALDLANCLVVGVASSALFDLSEPDAFFRAHGEQAYRLYQEERYDDILPRGVAYPFIERLLTLNDLRPEAPLVEVIVLSRNDPMTGLRVMRSLELLALPITRAVFTQGRAPYDYIGSFEMSLFLSGNKDDVVAATKLRFPAGHVRPSTATCDDGDKSLRVAFDFDGVVGDDSSEEIYTSQGMGPYREHESGRRLEAMAPGPLQKLLADLNMIQGIEAERAEVDPDYEQRLRVSLVTARNAPAHERAVRSLRDWGVEVNDAFFLGGIEKARILQVLKPHIFFDDQEVHLTPASEHVAGVHVPYGIANRPTEEVVT
jgi:5'-nucleotidase